GSTLPGTAGILPGGSGQVETGRQDGGGPRDAEQLALDIAFRVVADHIRTLSFAIADGIVPSNTDRNYVLRRILRRAVMFGRYLGFGSEGLLSKLVSTVVDNFGSAFPELQRERKQLVGVLDSEEVLFNHTL